jgi:hypothetical protein
MWVILFTCCQQIGTKWLLCYFSQLLCVCVCVYVCVLFYLQLTFYVLYANHVIVLNRTLISDW